MLNAQCIDKQNDNFDSRTLNGATIRICQRNFFTNVTEPLLVHISYFTVVDFQFRPSFMKNPLDSEKNNWNNTENQNSVVIYPYSPIGRTVEITNEFRVQWTIKCLLKSCMRRRRNARH